MNQMTSYYKKEEKHIRKLIAKYIKPIKRIMKQNQKIIIKLKNLSINKNLSASDTRYHVSGGSIKQHMQLVHNKNREI